MKFLYCFKNVSLTQRVLTYLNDKMSLYLQAVTVVYLHDCWVIAVTLSPSLDKATQDDCQAVLQENGIVYNPHRVVVLALQALDMGQTPIMVMDDYHVAIVSHGDIQLEELTYFQSHFVSALGYYPESLV